MASTTASLNGTGGKRVSRVLSTVEFDRLMAPTSASASSSSSSSSPGGAGGSGSNSSTGLTRLSATPVRHVLGRDESRLGRSSTSPSARGPCNRNMTDEDEEDDEEGWNSSNVDSSPDSTRTTRSARGANTAMGAAMQGFHRNATTASPFASSRKGQPKSRSPRLPHSDEIRPGAAAIESQPRVSPLPSPIKTLPALPPLLSSTTPDSSPLLNRDPQNLTPMDHHLQHPDAYQSKSKSSTPNPPTYGNPSMSSSTTTAITSTEPTRPRSISAATSGPYGQVQNGLMSNKPSAAPSDQNQYDSHSKQRKESVGNASSRDGAGVGLGNKGTRGVMGSSGEAKQQRSTSASSSFGNTMRKTSRFFRMVTGSSASASAAGAKNDFGTSARGMKSESSLPQAMTATTPIASTFASRGPVPAVPAVPAAYATPPKPSTSNGTSAAASATSAERQSSSIDLDIKRTPVKANKSGMSSSTCSSSRELSKYSPSAPPVSSMMSKKGSRRRSLSVGSAGAIAMDYLRRSGIGSPDTSPKLDRTAQKSGRTGTPRSVSASVRRSEEEQLVNELQQWKLNTDGVLDTKTPVLIKRSTTRTEGMSRSSSAGTPSGLPMFATPEAAVDPRIGRRQPSWNEDSTHGMHRSKSGDGAEGLMITPESTRSKSLPNPNVAAPSDGMRNAGAKVGAEAAPKIRLVSATATGHEAEGHEWRSGVTAENGQDLTWSPKGSASPLVIYAEAGHSWDLSNNTIKTPSRSLPDSPTLTVRSGSSAPSFTLNVESTLSPAHAHLVESQDQLRPSNQRNRALRSSVVAYPFEAAGSSTSLLGVTSRGSKGPTSLHSSPSVAKLDTTYQTPDELFIKAQSFAQMIWNEDEAFALQPKKYAEWLGTGSPLNALTLSLYIDRFDFTNLRLDLAFRKLCGKLYLKAETQQVDRILEQFSRRYYEQHATDDFGKMFKSRDVVHAASYSLLLLNTDLHVVDTTNRMTRTQFVRNTISAIQAQVDGEGLEAKKDVFGSTVKAADEDSPGMSKSESSNTVKSAGTNSTKLGALVDEGLEPMLKEMYAAIKAQPIFQPLSSTSPSAEASLSSNSLAPGTGQHLNSPCSAWADGVARTTSRRSANSTLSSSSVAFKRQSIRGFGGFLGASTSSADIRSTSPTPSAATSMSDGRYSSSTYGFHQHHHVPTIGFANSLSHTIIREQQEDETASDGGASVTSVTDEELALLGAPWAKEGLLWRKHYWESTGKRSKEKSWLHAFVVISAGQVKMFRFDAGGGGSMRGVGGGMGGGDWTSNAQNVGEVSLIHALCSAMPPPGYSRDRPHCFVLTLPSGGSYFFQAGTPDLVAEWVSTCNYWSARLSKEPLAGGVSNMDYGWGRVSIDTSPSSYNNTRGDADAASIRSGRSSGGASRLSIATGGALGRDAPPMPGTTSANDRIVVNDWTPPNQPGGASQLSEESQLEALKKYAEIVKKDLAQHNVMRSPMMRLYSPRSTNAVKSLVNWERKSQYLLAEIVKYQTYIEALSAAIKMRALRRGQKEVDAMLESADDDLSMDEEGRHAKMNGGVSLDTEADNESELGHRDGGEGADSEPTVSHSTDVFGTPEQVPLTPPTPNFASGGSRTKYRSGAPSSLSVTTNGTQEDVFYDTETRASDTI